MYENSCVRVVAGPGGVHGVLGVYVGVHVHLRIHILTTEVLRSVPGQNFNNSCCKGSKTLEYEFHRTSK